MRITDKQRMDLIEERQAMPGVEKVIAYDRMGGDESWHIYGESSWHPDLRQAIDAAIIASRKTGRRK